MKRNSEIMRGRYEIAQVDVALRKRMSREETAGDAAERMFRDDINALGKQSGTWP